MAGLPGPAAQLGLGGARASAEMKVLAALPADWQADARRVGSRFHLDPVGWYQNAARVDHLPGIAEAVWSERRIAIRYESWKDVVERVVDPLGTRAESGRVVPGRQRGEGAAHLPARQGPSRSRCATSGSPARASSISRDSGRPSMERFEASLHRGSATLRASPRGLKWLRAMSAAIATSVDRTAGAPDSDGWSRVTIPIESVAHAAGELVRPGRGRPR
jgi:hypothetical protein